VPENSVSRQPGSHAWLTVFGVETAPVVFQKGSFAHTPSTQALLEPFQFLRSKKQVGRVPARCRAATRPYAQAPGADSRLPPAGDGPSRTYTRLPALVAKGALPLARSRARPPGFGSPAALAVPPKKLLRNFTEPCPCYPAFATWQGCSSSSCTSIPRKENVMTNAAYTLGPWQPFEIAPLRSAAFYPHLSRLLGAADPFGDPLSFISCQWIAGKA